MKSDLVKLRHARSTKDFPGLTLEENEYVELAIRRSKVGLILIWAGEAIGFLVLTLVAILLMGASETGSVLAINREAKSFLYLIILVLFGTLIIAGLVGARVYKGNELFVTNKRLIHRAITSLFASSTNVIDLVSIEDVSFKQAGIIEYIFKLGTFRMSTVGDETTYTFKYVDTPTDELEKITHLVHMEKEKTKESYLQDRARIARERSRSDLVDLPTPAEL